MAVPEVHHYSGLTDPEFFAETDKISVHDLMNNLAALPPEAQIAIINDCLFHAAEIGNDARASEILDILQASLKT